MNTKKEIINALKENKVVIVPTDTVWGIAATFSLENCIKVAKTKGNVLDKKYTVMFTSKEEALKHWEKNDFLTKIVMKHMPGDLTVIAKAKDNDEFLGVRIPDDKELISIIEEVGPIIATSANISGQKPLETASELKEVFPDLLILNGTPGNKAPSTIIKIEGSKLEIIRQGDKVI